MLGYLHSIETMGTVDGPGVRTVVFLQGCKLRCCYCHNPDTWKPGDATLVDAKELMKKLLRFRPYYLKSGGGVTISGGEPLLQPEFLKEVLKSCKQAEIHTCIDTAGVGLGDYGEILQYTDLILYDVKHYDPALYQQITGKPISHTLEFVEAVRKTRVPMWVRHVVVPGLTDGEKHLQGLREYICTLPNVEKVELLPYHCLGSVKYEKLNLEYPLKDVPPMDRKKCAGYENTMFANWGGYRHVG